MEKYGGRNVIQGVRLNRFAARKVVKMEMQGGAASACTCGQKHGMGKCSHLYNKANRNENEKEVHRQMVD
ncbi:MAG: hypothetical protein Q7W38_14610 [Deltaproteobacteria bacterium]|nr:hypothetical protein [Deltaproteobacteria bacterium]